MADRVKSFIQKLIIPATDLGMISRQQGNLTYPDDVPPVIAVSTGQSPIGPRITQLTPLGQSTIYGAQYRLLKAQTTEGANTIGPFDISTYSGMTFVAEIAAIAGAPTNIIYYVETSFDGGTTYYKINSATVTVAGLALISIGTNVGAPGASLDVKASTSNNLPLCLPTRVEWVFTGGTAPQVTHTLHGLLR